MSRQTRRSTRQTASFNEEPGAPVQSSIPPAQQRHPIARRGTRRSSRSRRSVSIDHVKSSGDIGYDDVDENGSVIDAVGEAAGSQDSAVDQNMLDMIAEISPVLARDCNELAETHQKIGMDEPTNRLRIRLTHQYNSLKSRLGKLGEDEYLDALSPPWDNSLEVSQDAEIQPQEAAFRANTVTLLNNSFEMLQGNDSYEGSLFQHLDGAFPAQFSSSVEPSRALDLAFRIRCHHFGTKLKTLEKAQKPVLLAVQIFCDAEYSTVILARQRLASGPYKPFLGLQPSDSQALEQTYQTNMEAFLTRVLNGRTLQAIHNSLEDLCPKETLLKDLRSWALDTYRHHSSAQEPAEPEVLPGAEEPSAQDTSAEQLDDELDDDDDSESDDDDEVPAIVYQEANGPEQGSFFDGTATIAKPVSSRNVSNDATKVSPPATQIRLQEKVRDLSVDDILGSQPNEASMDVDSKNSSVQDDMAMSDAADDHDSPEEDEYSDHPSGDNDEDEDDEDDIYEERTAPVDQSRRQTAVQSGRLSRRAHVKPHSPIAARPQSTPSSSAYTARPASPESSTAPLSSQKDLRTLADRNIRAHKHKAPRRARIFWSDHDANLLIEHIRKHDTRYTRIAEEGGFEIYRDHQACRDKARNIKFRLLQTDQVLPPNFDNVLLSEKEVQFVRNAGRNPNRCEDDVDRYGRPVNTIDPESF